MVNLEPVGPEYFSYTDKDEAVMKAVEFVNALRRLGVDFPEIHVEEPCKHDSADVTFSVGLGNISMADAERLAVRVNEVADIVDRHKARERKKARKAEKREWENPETDLMGYIPLS
ncbi:hypothetical protein [Streptomyces sp. Tu6071]|uniref:hypothetical protein n=1 Tax=Streptomyces sp. Tu6071 TaxID=355249 RepID=UPI001319FEEA|nr:hypothetical protein [Streptomyces sp. Tu6071]